MYKLNDTYQSQTRLQENLAVGPVQSSINMFSNVATQWYPRFNSKSKRSFWNHIENKQENYNDFIATEEELTENTTPSAINSTELNTKIFGTIFIFLVLIIVCNLISFLALDNLTGSIICSSLTTISLSCILFYLIHKQLVSAKENQKHNDYYLSSTIEEPPLKEKSQVRPKIQAIQQVSSYIVEPEPSLNDTLTKHQHQHIFDKYLDLQKRQEMLTNMSHEVKTPIASMKVVLEGMIDGIFPTNEEYLQQLITDANRLNNVFDELKTLQRITDEEIEGTSNIFDIIMSSYEYAEYLCDTDFSDKNIQCQINEDNCYSLQEINIPIQQDKISNVMDCIIDNAFKHAEGMSLLSFDASLNTDTDNNKQYVTVIISDDGRGTDIPYEQLVIPFWKEDVSHTRTENDAQSDKISIGTGLSKSHAIIAKSGGWIDMNSSQGHGMQIMLNIPVL